MQRVLIGCSGWNYKDWKGPFYPAKGCPTSRWLEYYAQQFPTVEINSTFYRLASKDAVARWLTQVPDDFVFAPKISRYITHIKRLGSTDAIDRFYEHIEPLLASGSPALVWFFGALPLLVVIGWWSSRQPPQIAPQLIKDGGQP